MPNRTNSLSAVDVVATKSCFTTLGTSASQSHTSNVQRSMAFCVAPSILHGRCLFVSGSRCAVARKVLPTGRGVGKNKYGIPKMGLFDTLKRTLTNNQTSSSTTNTPELAQDFGEFRRVVDNINAREDPIERLTDDQLVEEFERARSIAAQSTEDALELVYALVREATFRVLGLRHYDVQILGGIHLHGSRGNCVIEMATGEGKTIVAALPAALNAAAGTHVLVVTVNDYLAKRDADLVGQVHRFLGLTVGCVQAGMSPAERRAMYACDITYVTNSELGFDYLRDNLAFTPDDIVLTRPFGFCIVDEADSILIDEARTPLIISGKEPAPMQKYSIALQAAQALQNGVHYTVNEKEESVVLSERGYSDLENALKVSDLFDVQNPWAAYITNALKAKEIYKRDVNYIVSNADDSDSVHEIQIVDEFTGRVLKGRRWSNGLHQAVEAKEGLTVSDETTTAASISYQTFFKLFDKLAGMTGTAMTESEELKQFYGLNVVPIPTALPCGRKDYPDVVFKNMTGKLNSIMGEIARVAPTGRPILIGTTSVESSEALSRLLSEVEVEHEVLNAKPESALRESEIIAQAGRKFSITIATNMAGRGTDILLGGNADYFARALCRRELVKWNNSLNEKLMALNPPVLIDSDSLPADLSDEIWAGLAEAAEIFATKNSAETLGTLAKIDKIVSIAAEYGPIPEAPIGLPALSTILRRIKEELKETVDQERDEVLKLGGLYIIGTERAESRRVDLQLRGRAGRQGDPGSSRFFLALDDRLFKLFGGDRIAGIMETFRVSDDLPLENEVVSKNLDSAQENVESYFRDIRGQLLSYDEVMSKQRSAVYSERKKILVASHDELIAYFRDDCQGTASEIISSYVNREDGKADNYEGLEMKLAQFFKGLENTSVSELKAAGSVVEHVDECVDKLIEDRQQNLSEHPDNVMVEALRYIWLTQFDNLWKAHMKSMDHLKEFIVLRSYGNDDPLQQYQIEGFDIFQEMLRNVRRNTVYSLFQYEPKPAAETAAI